METRKIGSLEVSVIAVGCHDLGTTIDDDRAAEVVRGALDAGINYFDTAEIYGAGRSEEALGKALSGRRDEAIVATKYDGTPDVARAHVEASLQRLGIDHIDLYTLHHPAPGVPVADTLEALGALVAEGKIREFGCSNMSLAQLSEAAAAARGGTSRFASLQNDYNLFNRKMEFEVLPECVATGTAFTAYFPLYHGFLTGKFRRGETPLDGTRLGTASEKRKAAVFTDEHFAIVEALAAFAEARGHTVTDVALARLLAEPGVAAVLPGAWSAAEARENAAAGSWRLSPDEVAEIDRIAPRDPAAPDTPQRGNGYP